ncbi:hypothetical protein AMAG_20163 [Allomyces macrogynus ATCC 38327]|uniref:Uncharacterized protein n=1 Tax=Allomyces macrogynus (strain ATCC 38327) TaxID=578462 RepID=A0A0L0T5K4_ALLM3|nr:hypothetical protein AMAG_20163 [Allomyces macrogynus ATCC 38327]|eukprot:KNE70022.1 hypothetical protein AMAG_20163 [Allomyces macrogynus ATCC 38327]
MSTSIWAIVSGIIVAVLVVGFLTKRFFRYQSWIRTAARDPTSDPTRHRRAQQDIDLERGQAHDAGAVAVPITSAHLAAPAPAESRTKLNAASPGVSELPRYTPTVGDADLPAAPLPASKTR